MQNSKTLKLRLHTYSEDKIKVTKSQSFRILKRPRLNTVSSEQQIMEKMLVYKNKGVSREQHKIKLSPIKYYETRLSLSCQIWCVFNLKSMCYKRGWKPKVPSNYSSLSIIILVKTYLQLIEKHKEVEDIKIKIRTGLLKSEQKKDKMKENKLIKLKRIENPEESSLTLTENTIISLKDLVNAAFHVNKRDLLQYTFIYLAYILVFLQKDPQHFLNHNNNPEDLHIDPQLQNCTKQVNMLTQYINKKLQKQSYLQTKITQQLQITSSSIQITRIFADMIVKFKEFMTMIEKKEVVAQIKYSMGYKFYEQRKLKFPSQRCRLKNHFILCNRSLNDFNVISYNSLTKNIIVLCESRFGMAELDIGKIQEWLEFVAKPIIGQQFKSQSLSPLMSLVKSLQ